MRKPGLFAAALALAAALAGAGQLAALASTGRDADTVGDAWRSKHHALIDQEELNKPMTSADRQELLVQRG